mmetsp:Transcript_31218/g.47805  ORF Transcript_31218/g.47805 Transcript_31218/m.47805 type:complete len:86 (+) Transcript_31218:209-466(+)
MKAPEGLELVCSLKKFFALFYSQLFLDSLDLSFNELLNESFGQFVVRFLDSYDLGANPHFQLNTHLEAGPLKSRRSLLGEERSFG